MDQYFDTRKKIATGTIQLFLKNLFIISALITAYTLLVFFTPPAIIAVFLCALTGVCLALIGFNIMHEGAHQSISRHKWLNSLSAYALNMMGGNSYFWKLKHNISHHTYTNISGADHDLNLKPFLRLEENQPRYWFHRYQHFYWIFLYAITYLAWVLYQDFQKYFTGRMAPGADEKHSFSTKEHIIFWITKAGYLAVYIGLPVIVVGWGYTLTGYLIAGVVCGLFISIVFQMAHSVELADFPMPDKNSKRIENEWAIHQVVTTANFGTQSKVMSWMLGGLNYQVEHHLFPKISHVYYPKISPLVKDTCAEYGVPYHEYPTLYHAFKSHLKHLKKMGRKKNPAG